jgi:trk system potassium uptake protein TrkH
MLAYSIFLLTAFILYSDKYSSLDLIFEVTSALANIGLSAGVASPEAPLGLKLILIVGMLLGRLEIIPYIVALSYLANAVRR